MYQDRRTIRPIVGQRFGRLVFMEDALHDKSSGYRLSRFRCDCGNEIIKRIYRVASGHTQSCGCLARDRVRERNATHGRSETQEFTIWVNMLQRCENPNNPAYDRYGGRGIIVCKRWRSFANFFADMGPRPKGLTLERRDNNGPYALENCYWATRRQQGANKRNNHLIEFNGEMITLAEASRRAGIDRFTLRYRLKRGHNPFVPIPRSPERLREAGRKGAAARWHK
jgi:hypothetical protein